MHILGFLLSCWWITKRMELSNFASTCFKTNMAFEKKIRILLLLNLCGTCGVFFLPFSLFYLPISSSKLLNGVNRAMLLLLLQSLGEPNNLAECSSSQIFIFLTCYREKGTASDSFTSEMKKNKVESFHSILWFETDVKSKGLISHSKECSFLHGLMHWSGWLAGWVVPRSGDNVGVMETAII